MGDGSHRAGSAPCAVGGGAASAIRLQRGLVDLLAKLLDRVKDGDRARVAELRLGEPAGQHGDR